MSQRNIGCDISRSDTLNGARQPKRCYEKTVYRVSLGVLGKLNFCKKHGLLFSQDYPEVKMSKVLAHTDR